MSRVKVKSTISRRSSTLVPRDRRWLRLRRRSKKNLAMTILKSFNSQHGLHENSALHLRWRVYLLPIWFMPMNRFLG
ncbi:unnamed protein product [Phytomonas sp. EM1]|nr:unnamed protein product [Phytomonas sp. EM1]|eukprot:CCW65526.1 unnamed protein product [Phytomonas sp. isolate EM1]